MGFSICIALTTSLFFSAKEDWTLCFVSQYNTLYAVSVPNDTTLNGLVKTLEMAIKSYKTPTTTSKQTTALVLPIRPLRPSLLHDLTRRLNVVSSSLSPACCYYHTGGAAGGRFKQPAWVRREEEPGLSKAGGKELSVGTSGSPREPVDTHSSNPLQLVSETLTEGM